MGDITVYTTYVRKFYKAPCCSLQSIFVLFMYICLIAGPFLIGWFTDCKLFVVLILFKDLIAFLLNRVVIFETPKIEWNGEYVVIFEGSNLQQPIVYSTSAIYRHAVKDIVTIRKPIETVRNSL